MSTLIVRDATLAVNGAPETRGAASEHLRTRAAEVRAMDPLAVGECLEVLEPLGAASEEVDPEALLALTILGLSQPELARERGVTAVASGRRLAARLEQTGESQTALEVIEVLREEFPTHEALERDHDAILRRLGMVQDLAERYFQRAVRLLAEKQPEEAAGWLREVLILDGSRKEAARLLRDLRLREKGKRRRGRRVRVSVNGSLVVAALVPLLLVGVVRRERQVLEEYRALPEALPGDLTSSRRRLGALEEFIEDVLVWHGAFYALSERSSLRVEVDRLEDEAARRAEHDQMRLHESAENARLMRSRALLKIDAGDFAGALEDLREALSIAPDDWPQRVRVERDVEAVEEYIAEELR